MIGRQPALATNRARDRFSNVRIDDLAPAVRRLVELFSDVHYGRIDGLTVRNGAPDWAGSQTVTREVRFPRELEQSPVERSGNHQLKVQVIELIDELRRLPDGTKVSIEIKSGLPFRLFVTGQRG